MSESNRQRLQKYALVGARAEVIKLQQEVEELRESFPSVSSFVGLQEDLMMCLREIDDPGAAPARRARGRVSLPSLPSLPGNGVRARVRGAAPRRKPGRARGGVSRGAEVPIIATARLKSWLTGRDVLALLKNAGDEGMSKTEIAKRLHITKEAAYARLKVRESHGHIRFVSGAAETATAAITPEGLKALAADGEK